MSTAGFHFDSRLSTKGPSLQVGLILTRSDSHCKSLALAENRLAQLPEWSSVYTFRVS